MDPQLQTSLIKLAVPTLASVVVLFATWRRGISWKSDLGLRVPHFARAACWLGFWVVWIWISEQIIRALGLEQAKLWPEYPLHIFVIRIAAIGLAGPILEELVTRGLALHLLRKTSVGTIGAILITAVVWSCFHFRYEAGGLILIAVDGVIFALSRIHTGSLWVPIAMHILGNNVSIFQSITGYGIN